MSAQVIDFPNVKIEFDDEGGPDQQILLEQDWAGNVERVGIHPLHVRYMAERLGYLPASDVEAQRTIDRLSRQLRALRVRISTLDEWLIQDQQKGHEDLELEVAFSVATLDIIDEYIAMLPDAGNPPKTGRAGTANPPKSGPVLAGNDPKTGAVAGQLPLMEGR